MANFNARSAFEAVQHLWRGSPPIYNWQNDDGQRIKWQLQTRYMIRTWM